MTNNMEKTFIRVRSVKDITIFISLIVLGGILIALPIGEGINITGFFLIFAGIILAFCLKTGYKDQQTGEKFSRKERYFQQAMHAVLSDAIVSRPESIDLSEEDKGNAIKLDIYFNRETDKAYIQLFEYVPYKYEPCSEIYEYNASRITNLIK